MLDLLRQGINPYLTKQAEHQDPARPYFRILVQAPTLSLLQRGRYVYLRQM